MTEFVLTGRKVFAITASAFAVIIGVNIVLAVQAVRTFPGLEVDDSYVASQTFNQQKRAQEALGWTTSLSYEGGVLRLGIAGPDGLPAQVADIAAELGRPTDRTDDVTPDFRFDGQAWVFDTQLRPGNWELRLKIHAADGTLFLRTLELKLPVETTLNGNG